MIEINPHQTVKDKKLEGKRPSRTGKPVSSSGFDSALDEVIEQAFEGDFDRLMGDLGEQERRFLDTQSLYELQQYKQLLQKILKLVMDQSFEPVMIQRRRRDRADYLVVNTINGKVEELFRALASPDNKAYSLMKTLEEIRGLLCDLVY